MSDETSHVKTTYGGEPHWWWECSCGINSGPARTLESLDQRWTSHIKALDYSPRYESSAEGECDISDLGPALQDAVKASRRKKLPLQFVVLRIEGVLDLHESEIERLRTAAFALDEDIEYVRMEHVSAREHCEMCGRKLSIYSFAWFPQKDGTFVFNCKDERACKNARIKEFAKEYPEI